MVDEVARLSRDMCGSGLLDLRCCQLHNQERPPQLRKEMLLRSTRGSEQSAR